MRSIPCYLWLAWLRPWTSVIPGFVKAQRCFLPETQPVLGWNFDHLRVHDAAASLACREVRRVLSSLIHIANTWRTFRRAAVVFLISLSLVNRPMLVSGSIVAYRYRLINNSRMSWLKPTFRYARERFTYYFYSVNEENRASPRTLI